MYIQVRSQIQKDDILIVCNEFKKNCSSIIIHSFTPFRSTIQQSGLIA
jgi:hypothetical protein